MQSNKKYVLTILLYFKLFNINNFSLLNIVLKPVRLGESTREPADSRLEPG